MRVADGPVGVPRGGDRRFAPVAGANVFAADQIACVQRARVLSAMVEVACERGVGSASVADVVKRSGMSRRTFYEMFQNREDCFLACFEHALASVSELVLQACEPDASWRERIRAGLSVLLGFIDEHPGSGRVLIVESLTGGPRVAQRRAEAIRVLVGIVDQGRRQSGSNTGLPAMTGEATVGAVLTVISNRLCDPRHGPLVALTSELASTIVLPYLGVAAARRELERPVPSMPLVEREGRGLSSDPLKDAGLRLTYRTARVLLAVAEHPGASNRVIGETAEISDQGQASKLLRRLARSGLLANTGSAPGSGGPNAWNLTAPGARFVQGIRANTETNRRQNGRG